MASSCEAEVKCLNESSTEETMLSCSFSSARPNQKETKSNGVCFTMGHQKRRPADSLEFRKARSYCSANSKFDPTLQERIFMGDAEDVVTAVNLALGVETVPEEIPDIPRGLVLADNSCTGAFQ